MEKLARAGLLLMLAGLLAGCEEREIAAMRQVGKRAVEKSDALAQVAAQRLGGFAQPEEEAPPDLAQRVRWRLQWDQKLAKLEIGIEVTGDEVRLTGVVPEAEQRQRAVELAESTFGVARVVAAWTESQSK
ncbi:MAG TPA: BON domain-containing protein [Gemmatales bacterium]|nr:BON domain-containing protein [Gemmatales bacterium]HMP57899.1 BON domain-containing protein [Gemmatales bacterium]